jgi:hypothetical protein
MGDERLVYDSAAEEFEDQERCDLWHWNNGLGMCDKDECAHLGGNMDESYSSEGLGVFFDTGASKALIAEARSESWARHLATALNYWDKADVTA